MGLKSEERKSIIGDLISNSGCWDDEDREVLNSLSDEKLEAMHQQMQHNQQVLQVANAAVRGFKSAEGNQYRLNPETGNWEERQVENRRASVDDDGNMNYMDDEEDDTMDEDDAPMPSRKPAANSRRRPLTADEWYRQAPREIREAVNNAREIEQREKDEIISQLLVNVAESDRRAHYDRLQGRSLIELRNDLALVPKLEAEDPAPRKKTILNTRRRDGEDDVLLQPTMSFNKDGEDDVPRATVSNDSEAYESDEMYIQSLPPHLRARIMNAAAIEQKEKREIISQLTANLDSDVDERQLVSELSRMSLNQLRAMAPLAGRRDYFTSRPANYSGMAAPLNNARQGEVDGSDMLLPMTMNDLGPMNKEKALA